MDEYTTHRQVLAQLGFTIEKTGSFYVLKSPDGKWYRNGRELYQSNRLSEKAAWQDAPSLQALMPVLMRRMLDMHPESTFHIYTSGDDWHVVLKSDKDPRITITGSYGKDLYECVAVAFLR